MDYGRLITAMVTPFDQDHSIDWEQTANLISYLIEQQQTDSLVINGTTGESATLSKEEKLQLFEFAVEQARGRCRIIAGTGSNNTAESIEISKKAEQIGVDGLLLVAPYYNRPSQEGLYRHFEAIAKSTSLPSMIYNVPKRTGVNISAETTIRLAEIENITSTKEAGGDLEAITRIIANTPEQFRVYSGDDSLTLPILAVGGYGVVSVASHVIGAEVKKMMELFWQGDVAAAAKLHGQLFPIFSGLFCAPNPVPVKFALSLHGMNLGEVRAPLITLTEQEQAFVRSLFANE